MLKNLLKKQSKIEASMQSVDDFLYTNVTKEKVISSTKSFVPVFVQKTLIALLAIGLISLITFVGIMKANAEVNVSSQNIALNSVPIKIHLK